MSKARLDVLWAIRNARQLTAQEKVFLFVVESRGEMWTSARTAMADMGIGRTTFYATRKRLIERGLVHAQTRSGGNGRSETTCYRVDHPALNQLVPGKDRLGVRSATSFGVVTRTGQVPRAEGRADVSRTEPVRHATGKEDRKITTKQNNKSTKKEDLERMGSSPYDRPAIAPAPASASASLDAPFTTPHEAHRSSADYPHANKTHPTIHEVIEQLENIDRIELVLDLIFRGTMGGEITTSHQERNGESVRVLTYGELSNVTSEELEVAALTRPELLAPLWEKYRSRLGW